LTKRQQSQRRHIYLQRLKECSLDRITDAPGWKFNAARLCNAQSSGSMQKKAQSFFPLASLAIFTSYPSLSHSVNSKLTCNILSSRHGPQPDLRGIETLTVTSSNRTSTTQSVIRIGSCWHRFTQVSVPQTLAGIYASGTQYVSRYCLLTVYWNVYVVSKMQQVHGVSLFITPVNNVTA
jgi:hypothetical protein